MDRPLAYLLLILLIGVKLNVSKVVSSSQKKGYSLSNRHTTLSSLGRQTTQKPHQRSPSISLSSDEESKQDDDESSPSNDHYDNGHGHPHNNGHGHGPIGIHHYHPNQDGHVSHAYGGVAIETNILVIIFILLMAMGGMYYPNYSKGFGHFGSGQSTNNVDNVANSGWGWDSSASSVNNFNLDSRAEKVVSAIESQQATYGPSR